jgi:tripartite-type tricarboxylate transporter receptor subunit TctC
MTPVAMLALDEFVLWVNAESPHKTTQEYMAAAKAAGGKLKMGGTGSKQEDQIITALIEKSQGSKFIYVPYKGGAQAITDLIGGQVDVMFNGMVATYPHVKAGKIKLIAISSNKRNPQMPETPTVAESLPGFLTGSFQGLLAPAGTPKPVIDKLYAEVQRIANLPDIKERLTALGAEPSAMTPDQFGNWLKSEIPAMAKIVKDGKITVD